MAGGPLRISPGAGNTPPIASIPIPPNDASAQAPNQATPAQPGQASDRVGTSNHPSGDGTTAGGLPVFAPGTPPSSGSSAGTGPSLQNPVVGNVVPSPPNNVPAATPSPAPGSTVIVIGPGGATSEQPGAAAINKGTQSLNGQADRSANSTPLARQLPFFNSSLGAAHNSNPTANPAPNPCTELHTQAHPRRADTTLVDLVGDGLLTTAMPTAQLTSTLESAGYRKVNLQAPVVWCLPQALASKLVRPHIPATALAPHYKLIQGKKGQWQLLAGETENLQSKRAAAKRNTPVREAVKARPSTGAANVRPVTQRSAG
jgi:hypothetical protein